MKSSQNERKQHLKNGAAFLMFLPSDEIADS